MDWITNSSNDVQRFPYMLLSTNKLTGDLFLIILHTKQDSGAKNSLNHNTEH